MISHEESSIDFSAEKMRFLSLITLILCAFGLAQEGRSQEVITQEVITKVKRSPPRASGEGREYSAWYLLKSDPAPPGYAVSDSQLKLEGPNSCGTTAQCLEGERTESTSTWLFRIQGQAAGNASATNVAVLTTKYRKIGTEASYTTTARTPEKFSSRGGYFGCFDAANATAVPENDGPWCSLSALPPKPGYRIKSASFSLEGDRSCVGNDFDREIEDDGAECRLATRTDSQVTWQFKMLGHTDGPSNTAEKSFGKLVAVYEKSQ
jgi:hypothetical protein